MPELVGLGILFAVAAVAIKIGILIYFFLLMHRIVSAVERTEQRCSAIETEVRTLPR